MYNTTDIVNKADVLYLEAGIHENIKLIKARRDKSPFGNEFIEFTFHNEDGKILTHNESEVSNYNNSQSEEEMGKKVKNQVTRIINILSCWFSKEELGGKNFNSFKEFADWAAEMVAKANKEMLVRVKCGFYGEGKKSQYVSLPPQVKYTFIEPMTIPKESSKISKLAIDKFERPEVKVDEEKSALKSNMVFGEIPSNTTETIDEPSSALAPF